jgi:hypothetical protein
VRLQAFVKLESLPSIPKERREAYADLAMSIFQQHAPADPHSLTEGKEQQPERRGKQRHADDSGSADRDQVGPRLQASAAHCQTYQMGAQQVIARAPTLALEQACDSTAAGVQG